MKQSNSPHIQKASWLHCRDKVQVANPELAKIIDSISPGDDLSLWLVKYPYGTTIGDSQFYYPNQHGSLVTIHDKSLPQALKDDFAYAGVDMPAGVVLEKSIELFIETDDRIIPQALFMPGDIFALWGRLENSQLSFHPSPLMIATAGARSIFMIPNISDGVSHKRLRKDFNIKQAPPKNLLDQWPIFASIVNQYHETVSWSVEAALFTGNWLKKIKNDTAFLALYVYLLEQAWKNSAFWRNKVFYDFVFSCIQKKRNLKPNPYLVDTAKCLITIATGATPSFGVASDNTVAPTDILQKVYVESYGLKKYAPTLMHPVYFLLNQDCKPVYYSLLYPTTLEFSPRSRQLSNTLHDLSELKHVLSVFLHEIGTKTLKIEQGIMDKIAMEVNFDFFHSKIDKYGEISFAGEMITTDLDLIHSNANGASKRFADSGAFVRGCIRLSNMGPVNLSEK